MRRRPRGGGGECSCVLAKGTTRDTVTLGLVVVVVVVVVVVGGC